MAKVDDYEFKRLPQQLIDFKDDVRILLNNGKYQSQFITATTAPNFAGNAGESVFVLNAASGEWYVFSGFAWDLAAVWTATTA